MFLEKYDNKRFLKDSVRIMCDKCHTEFIRQKRWCLRNTNKQLCATCTSRNNGKLSVKSKSKIAQNNPTYKIYWMNQGFSKQVASFIIRCLYKKTTYEYWMHRGYPDEECIKLAEEHSKKSSVLCKEHWMSKGYSEEEAIKLVELERKKYSIASQNSTYDRKLSSRYCKEHWMLKGYSEEEAYKQVLNEQHKIHKIRKAPSKKRASISEKTKSLISYKLKLKNRKHSPIFFEYWMEKGYNEEDAKKIMILNYLVIMIETLQK